ncbi:MAG: TIGR01212 family radical SAM protein [Desulfobulbus sp.]|jgi:radical SAM protein (TIGR01212 family)|uniref:TIGR01212 family radical SAM protein n=1 Tax=Desulfobulbus sp. TaxID=895 RepID=UPI0028416178|nr:TIGR01212 family radical SAM protein [Desulfobulbus sp.]MDR2551206.1 TIGR01212 family radical SAM protein [Desulfobulbus sp.]
MSANRPRLRSFSHHCRERYGQAIGKIPLDLGHPCPNRERGGCLFCRPASFTPLSLRPSDSLDQQIRRGKRLLLKGRFHHYLAYFQQETPTALPTARLIPELARILADPACLGTILSTRPDAIADDLPAGLADLVRRCGKTCLVELGLQSIHERSLCLLNRNHSLPDFLAALAKLRAVDGLEVGVHLILGIPGETEADMLATVRTVGALPIQALKLHHLQVIADTPLQDLYCQGRVPVFTRELYLELLLRLLPHIPSHITLHRLWSTAHPGLLVAPQWHCLAGELSRQLRQHMEARGIWQGQAVDGRNGSAEEEQSFQQG